MDYLNFKDWLKNKYNKFSGEANKMPCQCPCESCRVHKDCTKCDCVDCKCENCGCRYRYKTKNSPDNGPGGGPSSGRQAIYLQPPKKEEPSRDFGMEKKKKWGDWWYDSRSGEQYRSR